VDGGGKPHTLVVCCTFGVLCISQVDGGGKPHICIVCTFCLWELKECGFERSWLWHSPTTGGNIYENNGPPPSFLCSEEIPLYDSENQEGIVPERLYIS
jgi:hypothetical protein